MNKKLLIFISICILFFVGGCPLPFNVAICGNDICETGEETVCPGDCPTEVTLTDYDEPEGETDTTDSDGDGIVDIEDICEGYDDTIDTDADGTPDGCDLTPTSFDDADGDGVSDIEDICEGYDDTIDTDADGTPDGCDSTPTGTSDTSSSDDYDSSSHHHHHSSSSGSTTVTSTGSGCYHKWQCTGWNPCEENGMQTRICYYVGNCTTEGNQSDTRQRCTYVAPEQEEYIPEEEQVYPTCYDGIKNQGEKGIDCDGPCPACEVPQVQEPQSNTLYVVLAIGLLLLIIAALGYIFRNKWMPYWEKIKSTFVKPKPQPMQFRQFPQRPQYQQPQQYRRY